MAKQTNAEKMAARYARVVKRDAIRVDALTRIAEVGSYDAQVIARKAMEDCEALMGKAGNPWTGGVATLADAAAKQAISRANRVERANKRDAVRVEAIARIAVECTGEAQRIAQKAINDQIDTIGRPDRPRLPKFSGVDAHA